MADKKISQLPSLSSISGSTVVLPIVHDGTTDKITVQSLGLFASQYSATTASNTFLGNQNITGNVVITGNTTVTGMMTVNQLYTNYETASVIYSSGSNKFGDQSSDKQEFTGSVEVNGTIKIGNEVLGNAGLNAFTSSINAHILGVSIVTSSIDKHILAQSTYTSSVEAHILKQSAQTGSQDIVNFNLSKVTASIDSHILKQATQTGSQDVVNFNLSKVTASIDAHILKEATQTGSQDIVNFNLSKVTASIDAHILGISTFTGSLRNEINAIEAWTASLDNIYATDAQLYQLYAATASFISVFNGLSNVTGAYNTTFNSIDAHILKQSIQTGSQESINTTISTVTGSLREEIGGIESYTSSLKAQTIVSNSAQLPEIAGLESYTSSLKAAAIVSSSSQIQNYFTFAQTASVNTFYGNQIITGGLDVRDGVTGSFKGNLAGTATNATNIVITNASSNANYAVLFTTAGVNGNLSAYTDAFGGMLYNPSTNKLTVSGSIEVSGSHTISGSLLLSGSMIQSGLSTLIGNTVLSGSIAMSGSTVQTGNNTLIGNTVLSGSIDVSGSSNFHNSLFMLTGSTFFTGSHDVKGNTSVTGSLNVNGNTILSGSINIASGSGFYRAGNKLFNYGQFFNTQTQSGSANTAYPMEFNTLDFADGVTITNNASGLPTRLTVTNTGVYNIQFSAQLGTTATETVDFSIWLARTGSAVSNTNGQVEVVKSAGGGNVMAAWNYMVQLNAGEYAELYYSKTTANGQIQYLAAQGTPTRPATPSTIVTVTQHA